MALIGIDLGTSNSLVAHWTDQGVKLIENALGDFLTPSVVSIADNGDAIVGRPALDRLVTHPDKTVASFKRWMGTNHEVKLAKKAWRAEELSALVLRSLKRDAEAALDIEVSDVVISIPAYFSDPQRKATINAAHLAGLNVTRLINEPTAAALAHGIASSEDGQFLILDLGGGTFDVSLLRKFDGVMEIRASAGDSMLGGIDFRDSLASHLMNLHDIDFESQRPLDRARFLNEAERIKAALSETQDAVYHINIFGKDIEGKITRLEAEELWKPLITRLRRPIERVIRDSETDPSSLSQIVLVGGASRMPLLKTMTTRLFGRFPLLHPNPDHAIAIGTALQSALHARHEALDEIIMTDVCPYTLGIASVEQAYGLNELLMSPIIERNAIIPQSREQFYSTTVDGQTKIDVQVYQGENMRPSQNILIGNLEVPVPLGKAGSQCIGVRFTYDVSGALEVEVKILSTGELKRKVFQNQSSLTESEIALRFKELSKIKLAPREQQENLALVARAERLYAEAIGEQRQQISALMAQFIAALDNQRLRDARPLREKFAKQLDALDQMWGQPQ
ncbi:molecular chaperone HscC [Rhizobium rhizogenes]|uniref:Molecular chaperone HscC n=1 Tax=Rhizobium rhizogenes TaxID=359 RepID=A0AA95AH86_RHIRH|nr:Hsp70 family protein [Rhizobium rhizogenes]TRA87338.1 molecular chaperone HscC [Rhizobium rhizogenes]